MIKVMDLKWDEQGTFIERLNRFLGVVRLGTGEQVQVHIHDPGRLPEILFPGNTVYLKKVSGNKRKTFWDLLAGQVDGRIVFTNSSYHRIISAWYLREIKPFGEFDNIIPEYKFGNSRLDFLLKRGMEEFLVEVKGCTLAEGQVALFPDAPTSRGRRHLEELIRARELGKRAGIIFLIFREETNCFLPNFRTDPNFGMTLKKALDKAVEIRLPVFYYKKGSVFFKGHIELCKGFK